MKAKSLLLSATVIAGLVSANAETTTPVGYKQITLKANTYNLIGLTLHEAIVAQGVIDSAATEASGGSITDTEANFTSSLEAGATYILELNSGALNNLGGAMQVITSWSGTTLYTPEDISSGVDNGVTTYSLRKAPTIADLFGATNTAGFNEAATTSNADVLWVPSGGGAFDKYYYHPGSGFPPVSEGWKKDGDLSADASTTPIIYADAILVQKRASDLNITITGEVKMTDTLLYLEGGEFNFVSGVYPAGTSLNDSGLQDSLKRGNTTSSADVVWMPDGSGNYNKYYYTDGSTFPPVSAGWKTAAGADAGTEEITDGIIIQRRDATINSRINVPY